MNILKTIINIISILMLLAGVILAYGDTQKDIPNLPAWLIHGWPFVFAAATFTNRFGSLLIAALQKWKWIAMIILIPFLSGGCAQFGSRTEFFYPNGKVAFHTNADATGISMKVNSVGSLKAVTLTHSTSIAAKGDAYSKVISATGDALGKGAKAFATP